MSSENEIENVLARPRKMIKKTGGLLDGRRKETQS
jgi:hypothetical protein